MPFLLRQASIAANNYLPNSMVMSGDGRLIAFVGTEEGKAGTAREVLVHDVATGITRSLASMNPALATLETSEPALSADGSKIAFLIKSTGQVGVLTLADGSLAYASAGTGGAQANDGSTAPALSADGRYVVFESKASNLAAGDTNGLPDIFIRDMQSGTTTRIEASDAVLSRPQISADGKSVLYADQGHLYLKNMVSGAAQRVSGGIGGHEGPGYVVGPYELSADGRYAVFAERIAAIGHFDSRHGADVYRKDSSTGELTQIFVPSQFKIGEPLPTYTLNLEPEAGPDASLVTYVRTPAYAPDTATFFMHDLANGEVSRFAPVETWPGSILPESSLSSDGSHFAYVFRPAGIVYSPERLQVSTVLRGTNAPGAGDQTIQGTVDVDTLHYQGLRADFQVAGLTVTDSQAARHGKDTLVDIERLHFNDGNIALDTSGVAGQVFRLYQAAFGRAPDEAGAGFWIDTLDRSQSLQAMAQGFAAASEFQARFGTAPTKTGIVELLYQNVLHRAGDSAGIAYWSALLNEERITVPQLLVEFSESGENFAALVGVLQGGVPYLPYQ